MSQASYRSQRSRRQAARERVCNGDLCPVPMPRGHEVPGYSGHVSGVIPENIHGKTFRAQNCVAVMGGDGAACSPRTLKMTASAPHDVVPGYMGHMPGVAENVFARGWTDTKVLQREALDRGGHRLGEYGVSSTLAPPAPYMTQGRAGSEVPGYSGYIPGVRPEPAVMGGTSRNIHDEVHTARGLDPTARPPHYAPMKRPRRRRDVPHKDPNEIIPGYMGHVAGSSENIHGRIHLEANHAKYEALGISGRHGFSRSLSSDYRRPRGPRLPREVEGHTRGVKQAISLPGYAGHVPGKIANNVMGRTFRAANVKATKEKFHGGGPNYWYHKGFPNQSYYSSASCSGFSGCSGYSGSPCYYTPRDGASIASWSQRSGSSGGWASLASVSGGLDRGRTLPGETMRQPSCESLASTLSGSSVASSRCRSCRGTGRRAASAPPRRPPPGSDAAFLGQTVAPGATLKPPRSPRCGSARSSRRCHSSDCYR